jgi:hypothetical protein
MMVSPSGFDEPTPTAAAERRAAVRYPCEVEASCQDLTSSETELWSARVRDISTSGVGLLSTRRFDPGTALRVEMQSEDQAFAYTLMARVIHAVPHSDTEWLLGCAFARSLTESEVRNLL